MGINFNRQHGGTTKIPVGDNILLELLYDDLRKIHPHNVCPEPYAYFGCYGIFTVSIVTQEYKIKKKWKKQTLKLEDGDHIGKGEFRDLLMVKNKLKEIVDELKDYECFDIHGWDERRFKVYSHFLNKDTFLSDRMFEVDDTIFLVNGENYKRIIYNLFTFNDSGDIITKKKENKKNIQDWRMISKC